ncbi:MAG: site-specific integrase [Actinomycetota bacterium]
MVARDSCLMGHPKPAPLTWGDITFRTIAVDKVQARAWFIDSAGRGSYRRTTGPTKAAAKRKLLEVLRQAVLQADTSASTGRTRTEGISFRDLCAAYLERFDEVEANESTKHEQARLIRNVIMPSTLGDAPLGSLCVRDIDEFYQPLADQTRAQARNVVVELRKICDLGLALGYLQTNPARDFKRLRKRPKLAKYAPEPALLNDLHMVAVAYRTRPDRNGPEPSMLLEDVINVILGTSARIGEAVGLRWANIDLYADVPTVSILGTVIEKSATGKFYQHYPKTESGERAIPIPDFLVATLRRRLSENITGNPFVFHTATGRVTGPQDVHRALRNVRKWSETQENLPTISDEMVPRALRKSVASTIAAKEGLTAAANTLGHKESRVTEDHYVKKVKLAPDMRHVLNDLAPWADWNKHGDTA